MFNVQTEQMISGIFIKHVLEDSPAGRNGTLKTGDRILEVSRTLLVKVHLVDKNNVIHFIELAIVIRRSYAMLSTTNFNQK